MASSINVKIAPLPRGDYSSSATYAKLDVVSYNGSSYMAIKAVPTGTVPTNTTYWQLLAEKPTIGDGSITTNMLADGAVTADKLDSSVSDKYAEVSGTYEDMVVGSAEQLLSTQYDTDSVPYAFRKSPYGDREFDEIVGGSIAWNQCCPTANINVSETNYTVVSNNDGKWTITVTAQATSVGHNYQWVGATTFIANHVYAFLGSNGNIRFQLKAYEKLSDTIFKPTTSAGNNVTIVFTNLAVGTYVVYPQLFDLTQMFGSSVADAIYAMEQSTSGSGVAFFRGLFPKPYYAYNAGQLISVSGLSAHKMTGFNQVNTENAINATNIVSANNDGIITFKDVSNAVWGNTYIGYTDFVEGQTYYVEGLLAYGRIGLFMTTTNTSQKADITASIGSAESLISSASGRDKANFVPHFTGRAYWWYCTDANNSNHKVFSTAFMVNFYMDGSRNGEYEPYESHSYALDDSLTLRGVPKLVDSKVQFDGDIYSSDGTVTRKYGIITLNGTESWTISGASSGEFYTPCHALVKKKNYIGSIVCDKLQVTSNAYSDVFFNGQYVVSGYPDTNNAYPNQNWIYLKTTDAVVDANALKTWLASNPVTLVYELATPTTESASPYVTPQICNEYGTEEYVSAEQSGVTMIVGHNTKYPQNLRKKIEGLPWNFSSLIAPTEVTNKATRNYTVGSFLIMNNTLYKVTSAIANGGTITVGTNVTATTIMQEILAL